MTEEKKRSLIAKVVEDLFHLGYMHAKTGGSPRARLTDERYSVFDMRRLKSVLMRRHRVAKSASPSGNRQMQCRCSGKTTHAITENGRRVRSSAIQSRRQSKFAVSKSLPRRCSRFTVKNHVPPGVQSRR